MISKSMMIGQLPIELTLIICSYFECGHVYRVMAMVLSHVYRVMAMVFNVTFYNMSVISWRSALLMGETTNLPYVTGKFYHLKLYRVHLAISGIRERNFIGDIR